MGRDGGALGITGAGWSLMGVCEELAADAEVVVGDADWEGESDSEVCIWGPGLRLWTCQLDCLLNSRHENDDIGRNDSGPVEYPTHTVATTTISGTNITAHRNRRPIHRLDS